MPPRHVWTRHDLAMVAVSVIWGANVSAAKYGLRFIGPLPFSAVRFLAASVLLYLIAVRIDPDGRPRGPVVWRLAWLGVIGNTLYQLAFMSGLSRTSATNGALLMAAMPIVVATLSALFGIERISAPVKWGTAIGTLGVLLVVGAKGNGLSGATWSGDGLVLVAVICWSLFTVGVRRVGAGVSPLWITVVTTIGGTPGIVLAASPTIGQVPWGSLAPSVWVALIYSTVFALVIAYVLWSQSVQGIGGSRVALYSCVIPVFAIAAAWILLGERPRVPQLLGALFVIAGVVVSQLRTDTVVAEAA